MMPEQNWISIICAHAAKLSSSWVAMRRHLHQYPELSNREFQTTEYLVTAFERLGLPTHVSGEGRGMTADLTNQRAPYGQRQAGLNSCVAYKRRQMNPQQKLPELSDGESLFLQPTV